MELNKVKVKITRAERRGRKIIVVFEPDLFSDEVFAVNPFYDEGEKKNKLQHANFSLVIMEKNGKIVDSKVSYSGYHSTTGFRQIDSPSSFFLTKKECAYDWVINEDHKYFIEPDRRKKCLAMFDDDIEFQKELVSLIDKRDREDKDKRVIDAKDQLKIAIEALDKAIEELN